MASKKETFAAVTAAVAALCDEHNVSKKFRSGLDEVLAMHLAPKSSGAIVDIDEVTLKDDEGNITHLLCSVSGKFLPATVDFFYEDKGGKGVGETGLKRLSRQAESIRKKYTKSLTASEKALMADVLDGKLSAEDGKAKLEVLKAEQPDYSSVTDVLPEPESDTPVDPEPAK